MSADEVIRLADEWFDAGKELEDATPEQWRERHAAFKNARAAFKAAVEQLAGAKSV